MAFASIFVPEFIVQAVVRAEPGLREKAVAIVDGNPPLCRVAAANEKAQRAGIECGMSKLNAGQFSGVEIRTRSAAQEKSTHAALLDIGWSVSPRIEDSAPDAIVLDISGLTFLFPSEEAVAARLMELSRECGWTAQVATAANVDAAWIAARGFPGITVIPAGREAEMLGRLAVSALSLSPEISETLHRWGIHTCAALAALPMEELSERLGQEGIRLHTLSRGAHARSMAIASAENNFEEEMELDDGVEDLEPLSFLLGRLLDQLCARLKARALAAASIRVQFELQATFEGGPIAPVGQKNPRGTYQRHLQLPVPSSDSKMLLKLLRLRLQGDTPGAPIVGIVVAAEAARPRAAQGGLFLPTFPDPEKLELTIARITHVVGEENVGSPALLDTHRPGEFQMRRFVARPEQTSATRLTAENHFPDAPRASFRIFRPALPVQLELRERRPARLIFQGKRGEVLAAAGPWRTSGDWWREDPWDQDEWDVEVRFSSSAGKRAKAGAGVGSAGSGQPAGERGRYRIYYDVLRKSWFVRGIYD
jgi:protein ImuB